MENLCGPFKNRIGYQYIEEKGLEVSSDFGLNQYFFPRVFRISQEEGTFVGPFTTRRGGISIGLMESLNIRTKFDFYRVFRFCTIVLTDFSDVDSFDALYYHAERFKKWLEKNQETVKMLMNCMLYLYTEKIGRTYQITQGDVESFIKLVCYVFKLECPYGLRPS